MVTKATGIKIPQVGLSIREPWAWATVRGWKSIENRTWKPGKSNVFPFSMVVAASSSRDDLTLESDHYLQMVDNKKKELFKDYDRPCIGKQTKLFRPGCVLGIVSVIGVVDGSNCWKIERVKPIIEKAGFGEWYERKTAEKGIDPDRWAQSGSIWWLVDPVVQFSRPIPYKGALNLWKVKPELASHIAGRLARQEFGCPAEYDHAQLVKARKATIAAELKQKSS